VDKPIDKGIGYFQVVIVILSVYSLIALAFSTFLNLSPELERLLNYIDLLVCLLFLLDFFINFIQSENKLSFMKWGWIDLISSIPAVDIARPGRIVRLIRLIRLLRAFKSTKILMNYVFKSKSQGALLTVGLISLLTVFASSIAILQVETLPNCNIKTAEDALWWSYTTMTTVGYGDKYPVTTIGRVVAAIVMTIGVGLCGTFTAYIAAWFLEKKES
jgi:voltage-gated potassium channel